MSTGTGGLPLVNKESTYSLFMITDFTRNNINSYSTFDTEGMKIFGLNQNFNSLASGLEPTEARANFS